MHAHLPDLFSILSRRQCFWTGLTMSQFLASMDSCKCFCEKRVLGLGMGVDPP